MIHTFDLSKKIILITGGYGYLGRAVTESLVHHGAKVYVLGRDKSRFDEVFPQDKGPERNPDFMICDVSDSTSIEQAYKSIFDVEKRIDVLINNAFYLNGKDPYTMSDEDWASGIDGTLNSVFRCIRSAVPYLKQSTSGRIINVSSMYGVVAPDLSIYDEFPEMLNPPHYGAAKAAVAQLSRYYAGLLGPSGIKVNTVTPGPFPPLNVQQKTAFIDELNKRTCLKRIGQPEELAGAFVYLASEASGYMTGQNMIIDGGWTSR